MKLRSVNKRSRNVAQTAPPQFWPMSCATICTLLSKEAHRVSDEALCNELAGQALFKSLAGPGSPDAPAGIGLHMVKDQSLVKSTQKPATHNHLEKILKEPSVAGLANASSRLFGNTSLASMGFDELARSLKNLPSTFNESDALANGWDSQLWADLCCVYTMGLAARPEHIWEDPRKYAWVGPPSRR